MLLEMDCDMGNNDGPLPDPDLLNVSLGNNDGPLRDPDTDPLNASLGNNEGPLPDPDLDPLNAFLGNNDGPLPDPDPLNVFLGNNDCLLDPDLLNTPLNDSSLPESSTEASIQQVKENDNMTSPKYQPGFIFICNSVTKPTCFRFRVFGLPISKKDVVEKIKPGTKLFLYDVEMKLLYGIYEATSNGEVDLEPAAFGGKYPAQVKFRILEGSLPLPEKSFKRAISENYQGAKFSPELNEVQVKKLQLLFRPLYTSSSAPSVSLPSKPVDEYKPQPIYLPVQRLGGPQHMHDVQMAQQQSYARCVIETQHIRDIQMVHHQHHPRAIAQQHRSIPIEQYNNQQPGLSFERGAAPFGQSYYSQQQYSGNHSMIAQDHIRRQIALEETSPYYENIRSEGDYQRLLHQSAFQHQTKYTLNGPNVAPPSHPPHHHNYHPTHQQPPPPHAQEPISSGGERGIAAYYHQTKYALNGPSVLPPPHHHNYHPTPQQPPHAPERIAAYYQPIPQSMPAETKSSGESIAAYYHHHHQPMPSSTIAGGAPKTISSGGESIATYYHPSMPSSTAVAGVSETKSSGENIAAAYYHHPIPPSSAVAGRPETNSGGESIAAYYHQVPQSMPSTVAGGPETKSSGENIAAAAYYHQIHQSTVAGGPETKSSGENIAAAYYHQIPQSMPTSNAPETKLGGENIVAAAYYQSMPSSTIAGGGPEANPSGENTAAAAAAAYYHQISQSMPSSTVAGGGLETNPSGESIAAAYYYPVHPGESYGAYYYPVPSAADSNSVSTDPYAAYYQAYYQAVDPYGQQQQQQPSGVVGYYPVAPTSDPYANMYYSDGTSTSTATATGTAEMYQPQIGTSAMPEQTVLTGSSQQN